MSRAGALAVVLLVGCGQAPDAPVPPSSPTSERTPSAAQSSPPAVDAPETTLPSAAALARYAAASNDVDDWAILIEVRNLIRALYADELVLRVGKETFVFEAILTREDVLDRKVVQRRARRGHAVVWVYPFGSSHEIPVVTKPQDILVLDADRRVLETYAAMNTRGVPSPDGVMYIVVLPEGTIERLSAARGDAIELDTEFVHALSEMELQDRPTGRGI